MIGKIRTFVILIGLGILITITTMGIIKSCKTEVDRKNITTEKKWGLCWEDHEEKRCGEVKNISFHKSGDIAKMLVFFPSTKVTVEFFRDPGSDEIGIWIQKGDKGIWTLSPTKEGYSGKISDHKGWEAKLVVEKLISIR